MWVLLFKLGVVRIGFLHNLEFGKEGGMEEKMGQ